MCTELRSPLPFYLKRLSTLLQLSDPRVAFSSMPKPSPVASRSVLKRPARSARSMLKRPARCDWNRPEARHYSSLQLQQPPCAQGIPKPKFKCGQSVLHWWASWMESAPATPKTYNRMHPTGRPAWFSATICSVKEYGTIRYAGEEIKDNLYNVFCWHGRHEVVRLKHFLWRILLTLTRYTIRREGSCQTVGSLVSEEEK